jgi:hypothetical protein
MDERRSHGGALRAWWACLVLFAAVILVAPHAAAMPTALRDLAPAPRLLEARAPADPETCLLSGNRATGSRRLIGAGPAAHISGWPAVLYGVEQSFISQSSGIPTNLLVGLIRNGYK